MSILINLFYLSFTSDDVCLTCLRMPTTAAYSCICGEVGFRNVDVDLRYGFIFPLLERKETRVCVCVCVPFHFKNLRVPASSNKTWTCGPPFPWLRPRFDSPERRTLSVFYLDCILEVETGCRSKFAMASTRNWVRKRATSTRPEASRSLGNPGNSISLPNGIR